MAKKEVKVPLRITEEQSQKLDALKDALVRPSRNNTVEFLIEDAFKNLKLKLPK